MKINGITNPALRDYSNCQIITLTFLRVLIGWHFLYEGLLKLYTPGWTAKSYLLGSVGPFSSIFQALASNQTILSIIDHLNEWGLVIIGLGLFLGLFEKPLKIGGILLLLLYYFAYPPFPGLTINAPVEGSYYIVNKNLIEMAALLVLFMFPSGHITGIDSYIFKRKN
jgi:thiosulfate dehydrogenase [quinone] large subunit